MTYDNRPTEPDESSGIPEECPVCKRDNIDKDGELLFPSGHCSEHCVRHGEDGTYCLVDFDYAHYVGSSENGVYYAVGEGPDGWYLSASVDSSNFTAPLVDEDGPYKTEKEAWEAGKFAAIDWCTENKVNWAELPEEDDRLQFAQLLWYLHHAGIDQETLDQVAESMDLDRELLKEIFDRAIKVFEDAKDSAESAVLKV